MKQKAAAVIAPTQVNVLGKTYAIEWPPHIYDDAGEQSGTSSARHQVIKVATSHHPEQQQDTLLHEIVHAVDEEMGTKLEEEQVARLSTGLLQIMKSNPDVVAFILR